jgi:hypothetical protein
VVKALSVAIMTGVVVGRSGGSAPAAVQAEGGCVIYGRSDASWVIG